MIEVPLYRDQAPCCGPMLIKVSGKALQQLWWGKRCALVKWTGGQGQGEQHQDSRGQILALAFKTQSSKPSKFLKKSLAFNPKSPQPSKLFARMRTMPCTQSDWLNILMLT